MLFLSLIVLFLLIYSFFSVISSSIFVDLLFFYVVSIISSSIIVVIVCFTLMSFLLVWSPGRLIATLVVANEDPNE